MYALETSCFQPVNVTNPATNLATTAHPHALSVAQCHAVSGGGGGAESWLVGPTP